MSITRNASVTASLGGQQIGGNFASTGNVEMGMQVTLPAADTGTISSGSVTVTSNSGTPTCVNGTSSCDVFWVDGSGVAKRRYNCTFSVSGSVITVTSGAGDSLPSSGTVYCANQVIISDVTFDGTKLQMLVAACSQRCGVQFNTSVPAVLLDMELAAGVPYCYFSGTTPINGTCATISAANGSPTATSVQIGILLQ